MNGTIPPVNLIPGKPPHLYGGARWLVGEMVEITRPPTDLVGAINGESLTLGHAMMNRPDGSREAGPLIEHLTYCYWELQQRKVGQPVLLPVMSPEVKALTERWNPRVPEVKQFLTAADSGPHLSPEQSLIRSEQLDFHNGLSKVPPRVPDLGLEAQRQAATGSQAVVSAEALARLSTQLGPIPQQATAPAPAGNLADRLGGSAQRTNADVANGPVF